WRPASERAVMRMLAPVRDLDDDAGWRQNGECLVRWGAVRAVAVVRARGPCLRLDAAAPAYANAGMGTGGGDVPGSSRAEVGLKWGQGADPSLSGDIGLAA